MITALDTRGPLGGNGVGATRVGEDEEIEKEVEVKKEEGEESMMDGTGKHFSTIGCKNKTWIRVVPGQLTPR